MKVLVTGATGFIGQKVLSTLSNMDIRVVAALRSSSELIKGNIVNIGNVGPDTDWKPALDGVDVVIHTAARVHLMQDGASDPLTAFRRVNTAGTINLAKQAASAGVKRFIFISTIKVNGEETSVGLKFKSTDIPNPSDAYAISKYEAEQQLLALAKEVDMDVVIIRPPLVYGPGVKGNLVSMINIINAGVPLPFGSINNKRSLISLDNLVDLIITTIDHPRAANSIIMACDGYDISTTELIQKIAKVLGKRTFLIPVPQSVLFFLLSIVGKKSVAQRLLGCLQVDLCETSALLGWEPPLSIDDGIKLLTNEKLS